MWASKGQTLPPLGQNSARGSIHLHNFSECETVRISPSRSSCCSREMTELLYSLPFACPIPWPTNPSYPIELTSTDLPTAYLDALYSPSRHHVPATPTLAHKDHQLTSCESYRPLSTSSPATSSPSSNPSPPTRSPHSSAPSSTPHTTLTAGGAPFSRPPSFPPQTRWRKTRRRAR